MWQASTFRGWPWRTMKRMANEVVHSGMVVIQDVTDLFKWASNSNMQMIVFLFVSSEE